VTVLSGHKNNPTAMLEGDSFFWYTILLRILLQILMADMALFCDFNPSKGKHFFVKIYT